MTGPRVTADDLAGLRRAAEAATAGPWHAVGLPWNDGTPYVVAGSPDPHFGRFVCDLESLADDNIWRDDPAPDAEFIAAANPATVLALLDDLAAANAKLAAVEALIEHARKVSPSDRMTVYVGDLLHALGLADQPARTKLGDNDGGAT